MRNHQTHSRQLGDKLASISKPLKRKEGLTLSSGIYVPTLSFPETVLIAGGYSLAVPSLTVAAGSHIAITGRNGSGKTLFLKAFHEHLLSQGKGHWVLYIPQEFSDAERESLISSFLSLTDDERGIILSDLYRMGSEPSSLFSESPCPSPGELKKLALAMSRRDGRTVLIMDEPEDNLHPGAIRSLVKIITQLGEMGVQIFLSTHNYFVLKQLHIEARSNQMDVMCCSLNRNVKGTIDASFENLREYMPHNAIVEESMRMYDEDIDLDLR